MTLLLHPLLHQVGLEPPDHLANAAVSSISCDSRRLGAGTLFVGMEGTQVDGGRYWRQALAAGACAAVISEAAAAADPPSDQDPVLVVPSPVAHWAGELAAAFWQQPSQRLKLVGVTGTNGKTTTTHLIEHLSIACGHPSALFGTLMNRWPGTSVTAQHTTAFADVLQTQLAQAVEAGAQIGAMEVSSHALDQQRVAGTRFSAAVFTNLTQDHLDYHPSMEAYFEAKARLFELPLLAGADPNGAAHAAHAVINVDDPWGTRLAERLGAHCWRSSLTPGSPAELQMQDLRFEAGGVSGTLISPQGQGAFRTTLVGRFNLMNQLQAVGALLQLGLPLEALLEGLASFKGVPGRMERVLVASQQRLPAVLVDYAHTPDGLENALSATRPFCQGRLICVFGCGGDRDRSKRPQMGAIAARLADQVVVTSDNPRSEDPQQILADVMAGMPPGCDVRVDVDRGRAIADTIAAAGVDDLVLIAGKGHEDYQIIGSTKVHFNDREEAEQALRSRLHRLADDCAK